MEWTSILVSAALAAVPMLASLLVFVFKQGAKEAALNNSIGNLQVQYEDLCERLERHEERIEQRFGGVVSKELMSNELSHVMRMLTDRERQLEKLVDSNQKLSERLGDLREKQGRTRVDRES